MYWNDFVLEVLSCLILLLFWIFVSLGYWLIYQGWVEVDAIMISLIGSWYKILKLQVKIMSRIRVWTLVLLLAFAIVLEKILSRHFLQKFTSFIYFQLLLVFSKFRVSLAFVSIVLLRDKIKDFSRFGWLYFMSKFEADTPVHCPPIGQSISF